MITYFDSSFALAYIFKEIDDKVFLDFYNNAECKR